MPTYLVTGAAGFIASKVAEFLLAAGHSVVGIDNLNNAYDVRLKHWRLAQLQGKPGFSFHELDITDRQRLAQVFIAGNTNIGSRPVFDGVINLAARAGVRQSRLPPRAQLAEARARLQQTQGQVTPKDIAAAQAGLEQARARLRDLQSGPISATVERAQANVNRARAALEQQRTELSAAKEAARRQMEERANDLRAAQAVYAQANDERQRNSGDDAQGQAAATALAKAELAMVNAESVLERAKVEYEARRQDEITGLAAAEAQLAAAQADLKLLQQGVRPGDLASARAAVAAAEADLARLSSGERAGELEAANASVVQVQAQLDGLVAGPDVRALALSQATIEESNVRLQQAELRLAQATLSAPIAGTIAAVQIAAGETPNGREALLVLADTSAWRIEAQKLTDLDIVQIHEGDAVTISAYAIPDLRLPGRVTQVQPMGRNEQGKARYTAVIIPERWDERLHWAMPVQVMLTSQDGIEHEDRP